MGGSTVLTRCYRRGDAASLNQPSAGATAVFVATRGFALLSSRRILIRHLLRAGWNVVVATADDKHAATLVGDGCHLEPVVFERGGVGARSDTAAFVRLLDVFRRHRPSLIHVFHAKPTILTGAAARIVRPTAKLICTVTGLGYGFSSSRVLRTLMGTGYRAFLSNVSSAIFQNPDDLEVFVERRWLKRDQTKLVISSGVDTQKFARSAPASSDHPPTVAMICRLLWDKGVREFVEAAGAVRERLGNVRFVLAGELDPKHRNAVPEAWINDQVKAGVIEFSGYQRDMVKFFEQADIVALPSYYREGVPRVLLEAAAQGLPVIAADSPGCREAVRDGETGLLVPPRDVKRLENAVITLLERPEDAKKMGKAGQSWICREFDVNEISERYLGIYRSHGLAVG